MTIFDIGAGLEGTDRYASLVAQELASVIGFEGDSRRSAEVAAQRGGRYRALPYFLGDGREATFHITRYAGCSSLYEPDPSVIDLFSGMGTFAGGNFEVLNRYPVQTTRLDDVADCPRPDLLKLDVQGAELDVLRFGTRTLHGATIVEIETEFVPIYRQQPLFGDIQSFMHQQGFVFHKLVDVCGRCFAPVVIDGNASVPISQMLWADAVFVRDFATLFAADDTTLLKTALILHDVYASFDLVRRLLAALDGRRGSELVRHYGQALQGGFTALYLNQKIDPQLAWPSSRAQ